MFGQHFLIINFIKHSIIPQMAQDNDNNLSMQNNNFKDYDELSGKVLLIAVIILFALLAFVFLFNLFVRWRSARAYHRELRRRIRVNRRTQLFFYVNNNPVPGSAVVSASNRGLEPEVINSLPVFVYDSSKELIEALECSVCLSEFEDDDKGRVLPKCGHSFHVECVDMWFHAHSTCPLCRSKVELIREPESNRSIMGPEVMSEPVDDDSGREMGSRSGGAALFESPRKGFGVSEDETKSRRLSLKRLLSMSGKNPADVTTSCGVGSSGNHPMDLETGSTRMIN